jgi:hypothetical protein
MNIKPKRYTEWQNVFGIHISVHVRTTGLNVEVWGKWTIMADRSWNLLLQVPKEWCFWLVSRVGICWNLTVKYKILSISWKRQVAKKFNVYRTCTGSIWTSICFSLCFGVISVITRGQLILTSQLPCSKTQRYRTIMLNTHHWTPVIFMQKKIKVKFFLCLIKHYAPMHLGKWRSNSTIPNLGTRWKYVVCLMVRLLYPSTPGERAFTSHRIGGWASLRASLGDVEMKETLVCAKSPSFSHITCSVVTIPTELSWLLVCVKFVCNSIEGTVKWNWIPSFPGHISCCKTQISNTVQPVLSTCILVYIGVWKNHTGRNGVCLYLFCSWKSIYQKTKNILLIMLSLKQSSF